MRRGTPSAALFGSLLWFVRTVGTGRSMRQVADVIGAPPATVSQVEKGERALKEPKIAVWADALGVSRDDLHELWVLSQGQVPVGADRLVFYSDRPDVLGDEPLPRDVLKTLEGEPHLEPIYRLAQRIAAVLHRLLPHVRVHVKADEFEPPHIDKMAAGWNLTAAEEVENNEAADTFVPLPLLVCVWGGGPDRPQDWKKDAVRVPLLHELAPIVRRRSTSVKAVELEDLIHDLSGPERERVRGYIDAIVEQREAASNAPDAPR